MKDERKQFFFEKKNQKTFAHGFAVAAAHETTTPLPPLRRRGRGTARKGWKGEGPRPDASIDWRLNLSPIVKNRRAEERNEIRLARRSNPANPLATEHCQLATAK
jgi:hypothetical protein